jgi:serpin B
VKGRNNSAAGFSTGLIAALLCFLSCQSRAALTTNEQELTAANTGFGFHLLQQIATEQPGTNIFISPYSASTALQMVSTGAGGTTLTEMQQTLGTINMEPDALNEANKKISAIINSKNADFLLTTANALWYRAGTPVESPFIKGNESFFGATVEALHFNETSAVKIMNAWASRETHGKIDEIVSPPIPPRTRMFVANAVYFLGSWETPFDTNSTMDRPFYLSSGDQASLPMMEQTGTFSYYGGNGYQAVQLPYKGGNLSMYVFLPGANSSLEELLGTFNGAWWQAIQTEFSQQQGTVVLPKFTLKCAVDLVQPLQALGMTDAFTPNADFAKISREPLFVSDVKQQAYVEVNEQGTEATAVTTVTIVATAEPMPPPQTFQMIVDRPFLFFIVDQQAGTILFMGAVVNP